MTAATAPAAAAAPPATAGLFGRLIDREQTLHTLERATRALRIVNRIIRLRHTPQQGDQLAIFNASVFVQWHRGPPFTSNRCKGRLKILEQVTHIFDARREADE